MTKTRPAGTADTTGKTPANGAAGTPGPAAPRRSIFDLSRFAPSRVSRPATQDGTRNGGQPQQERPKMFGGMGKMLFGYLIFLVVAQYAIPLALSFADSALHLNLGSHVTADHNTPLLGGLTWYFALYIVLTLGVLLVLLRFNIIPRDPLGSRARMEAQRQARLSAAATPTGSGRSRTRAARRKASSSTVAAAPTPAGRKGAKAEPAAASARQIVPKAHDGGMHDDAYERVKAAQRLARRRSARR